MKNKEYRFKSNLVEIKEGEDGATNPMRYGKELSEWLSLKLEDNYKTTDCGPEDWGWYVEVSDDHYHYRLGCSNEDIDTPYNPDITPLGSDITWLIFLMEAVPKSLGISFKQLLGKIDKKKFEDRFVATFEYILFNESRINLING